MLLLARRIEVLDPALDPHTGTMHGVQPLPALAAPLLPGPVETRVRFRDSARPRRERGRAGRPRGSNVRTFTPPLRGLFGPKDLR